jgi:hypothetical protein
MLTLEQNSLTIRFPEIHPDAVCQISFKRTLRIPDDNKTHRLPPDLGNFTLAHVDDHANALPATWHKRGGVFLPMHQSEAMWIRFSSQYPFAVKIAAGKINAVTGKPWSTGLEGPTAKPAPTLRSGQVDVPVSMGWAGERILPGEAPEGQDYLAVPAQPWLDGFCVEKGKIRQFVAMPLGEGYTVEEQITGEAVHGGLQIMVYPLKPEFYRPRRNVLRGMMAGASAGAMENSVYGMCVSASSASGARSLKAVQPEMGMAPGGLMEQTIHADAFGIEKYDQSVSAKCFVHLLNSEQYHRVTGKPTPHRAPDANDYTRAGLPWFAVWEPHAKALPGAPALRKLDSVANMANKLGHTPPSGADQLAPPPAVVYVNLKGQVREGDF